jgi:uncharacterized protein YjbJ (UPF0337 family)
MERLRLTGRPAAFGRFRQGLGRCSYILRDAGGASLHPSVVLPAFRSPAMSINKDQVEGRVKEAAGKVQEVAGKTVGNTSQQVKGDVNKNVGAAQAKFGDAKSHLKDAQNKDSK